VADVRPFRAVRYARPSADVTAPPYDVIDEAACETLRARDAHNVVRLTAEPVESVAAERLARWLADGTLVRDEDPAVWALEQDYVGPDGVARRRDGIVASLRVEPYATGAVLPHERTHAAALEGRLRLLRATRTQLEPIFLLYEGPAPTRRPQRDPEIDVEGTRLWRLAGDRTVEPFFAARQLLIADGHHRYEAALAFATEDGADRMLVVLVSTEDPGLEVFPTHRLFTGRPDIDPPGDSVATLAEALDALDREPGGSPVAVFLDAAGARLVRSSTSSWSTGSVTTASPTRPTATRRSAGWRPAPPTARSSCERPGSRTCSSGRAAGRRCPRRRRTSTRSSSPGSSSTPSTRDRLARLLPRLRSRRRGGPTPLPDAGRARTRPPPG
jgi:hypothetical protein